LYFVYCTVTNKYDDDDVRKCKCMLQAWVLANEHNKTKKMS